MVGSVAEIPNADLRELNPRRDVAVVVGTDGGSATALADRLGEVVGGHWRVLQSQLPAEGPIHFTIWIIAATSAPLVHDTRS